MKKFTIIFLIALGIIAVNSRCKKETHIAHGKAGDIKWLVTKDNVLIICGKGECENFARDSLKDANFDFREITSVIIEEGITKIGHEAFWEYMSLKSIIIPNSVTTIENSAFYGCKSLTSITLPNSVTTIENRAFYGCKSLTSITLPNNLTYLGPESFMNCDSLTSITLPNSVTSINNGVFWNCINLKTVTIGNSVTNIVRLAFSNCISLIEITCLSPIPPSCYSDAFERVNKSSCILKVPYSSVYYYSNAPEWNEFNIVGI